MPKNYSMGGRAAANPAPGNPGAGPGPQTFRERLGALRNIPPFIKLVWKTSPSLALGQAALRLVRALLPDQGSPKWRVQRQSILLIQ